MVQHFWEVYGYSCLTLTTRHKMFIPVKFNNNEEGKVQKEL